jgi:hypothetical protein
MSAPTVPSRRITPAGRHRYSFDVRDHIADQVGSLTVASAAWTLPDALTELDSSITDKAVQLFVELDGSAENTQLEAICAVTFSDTQIHRFRVNFIVKYLEITVA